MQENAAYGTCDVPPISPPPPAAAPPVAVVKKAEPPTEEEFHVDTPLKLLKFLWVIRHVDHFLDLAKTLTNHTTNTA